MTFIGLKTGGQSEGGGRKSIGLKTGHVLELTISVQQKGLASCLHSGCPDGLRKKRPARVLKFSTGGRRSRAFHWSGAAIQCRPTLKTIIGNQTALSPWVAGRGQEV